MLNNRLLELGDRFCNVLLLLLHLMPVHVHVHALHLCEQITLFDVVVADVELDCAIAEVTHLVESVVNQREDLRRF